ncbi:MAG: molybdopterin-dependent oxidoreductase [Amaricoccus sp.]
MLPSPTLHLPAAAVAALLAAVLPAAAAGPVLVTVTGDISEPNRGPVDPDYDKLFVFNEVKFDKAREFDLDTLEKLPQATVHADFPKGGAATAFTGPLLSDVLAAAGADGKTVTVQAMDGYALEVPFAEIVAKGAVLALERDGKPLGIGNFGPTQIVFPRADRPELADMPDDWWIWQIYHIDVQ